MRVKFVFIFTNFPNFDLGKTFPILSDSIFLFLEEEELDKFA